MSAVLIIASIIAALLVFAIAAVIIGREARRLDSMAPRAVYELEQATQFVADNLPSETQARLTFAELRKLLVFHMRWLHDKGLQPAGVVDRQQDIVDEVVIDEQTLTAYLLDAAEKNNIEILDDVDAVYVVKAHLKYFDAIGAIGPQSND
ncbi:MAG: hypothetical protein NWS60_05030 [Ilumatobacteraceae bacterium]|jgi:hypothetical protein|nr:MAG: hypothetical protein ABR56_01345 [Acidimicrobium sp. BACL27 MAG-120823-bin4]MDA2964635.1 hypothetical protein [Actinomycetota bacterium]MDP4635629.1 hypothetical protein [Ilumatobacteraceae bacterium]MDP4695908.1 hypothetical protein [Ilumatobacteraceae bacterium]MDP4736267.1 hypothetical protein [Ilumatobacteraceae bacterium]